MCLCTCVFCRCGPHLHWAPHIEVKWHPGTVARRWWWQLQLRHQPSRFGAYSTLQEYHMWVKHPHKHTCIHIHTSGHTRTLERPVRLFFHYWSLVWWVTLSWPLTNTFAHPQEIGQVIIHADRNIYIHICQLSRLAFWFFFPIQPSVHPSLNTQNETPFTLFFHFPTFESFPRFVRISP